VVHGFSVGARRALFFRPCLVGLLVACFLSSPTVSGQSDKKPNQKGQDDAITLKTHLVTLDVMVKDNKGKYVTNIKQDEFAISENGTPQVVEFFDPPLANASEAGVPKPAEPRAPKSLEPSAPKAGGATSNIISLVLDGATTDLTNLKQVRQGMIKYIQDRIGENDSVALFGVSTDLRLLQSFTRDKAKMIAAVDKADTLTGTNKNLEQAQLAEGIDRARMTAGEAPAGSLPATAASAAQGQSASEAMIAARVLAQYIQLRSQLSAQQARPVLASLAAICQALRAIPGKKTVILFSQGFVAPTILDWQVQSVIDMANRSNVAIYIIDSAGLRTSVPASGGPVPASPLSGVAANDTTTDSRMRTAGGDSLFDNVRHEGLNREYDILYRISGDTGGEFLKGSNDLTKGLDRIDQEIRSRYTLAYYSTDPNFDGSFRKIKVDVRRPDVHVVSRSGYYANAGEDLALLSPDDKKLLAALPAAEASPGLPLFLEMSPFRFKEGRYVVPLAIEVPPNTVKFDQKGDKRHVQFEVLGVIRGADKIIARLGGNFNIELSAEQYQAILNNNIFYRQDMELAPGTYSIELLFRDKLSGKLAGKKQALVLPDVSADFSSSAIVLSRYAEAIKNPSADSVDVLSEQGVQIRPLPSRQFRVKDNLIIFFDLYNAAVPPERGKPLVRVTVTLLSNDKPAAKPVDYVLTESVSQPIAHLTFAKFLSLTGLTPGNYVVMIEANDMVAHKAITQRIPFNVTQP
jgi:VWFA-related protein